MAYSTASEVTSMLDNKGVHYGTSDITTVAVGSHITRADNIINAYVGAKYSVPFGTDIPSLINTISIDLAGYYIVRELVGKNYLEKPNWVDEMKRDAIELLEKIQKSKLPVLDSSGEELTASSQVVESNQEDYHPTFDEDDELDWAIDEDKLDDIDDNRE